MGPAGSGTSPPAVFLPYLICADLFSRHLYRDSGADLRGVEVDRRGIRLAKGKGNLWLHATMLAIAKTKKGDDRAATTCLFLGDYLIGCVIGNASDPVG